MSQTTRPNHLREKSQLMSASEIERTIVRLAHEIVEKNNGTDGLGLVGIKRRGVPLAQRLAKILARIEKVEVPVGTLDITLYRDDLSTIGHRPEVRPAPMEFHIQDKNIILVDDVLYSGRSVRSALDALRDLGRPRLVQLAVLVDRGHRELPLRADYVGKNVPTSRNESVRVLLTEHDGRDGVVITR